MWTDKRVEIFMEQCNVTDSCYALQLRYTVIFAPCNFISKGTCYASQFTMVLHYMFVSPLLMAE